MGIIRKMEQDFLPGLVVTEQGATVFKDWRVRLGVRKKFFMMRMLRLWNRLPRDVDVPSLEVVKVRWDGA